jgi:hypothetical protein
MTAIIMVVDQAVAMTFWQVVLVQGWHGDKVGWRLHHKTSYCRVSTHDHHFTQSFFAENVLLLWWIATHFLPETCSHSVCEKYLKADV